MAFASLIARGGVINGRPISCPRLRQGGRRCAGCLEDEPLNDFRLFTLPQVIGTPHIGAATHEATARIGDEVAEILIESSREPC
jgi:D-3-phosphoglycerate dehydrogenase